ncbi:hypothetical protein SAMN05444487_11842 [Marininema mesophilum]|uniref:Uncharacterized protein n=1 Tax=Marininema mesophilum TaxID=1048340 RepID=A0A1H3BV25_9BACL|nr:hypothetical protein [Marininema mesophilum]SDX45666.1 hypothetical protein SAMN05444487_11842 [Marininema mesophilum]
MKKFIAFFLSFSLAFLSLSSNYASASSFESSITASSSENLIKNATPYVKLDTKSKKFSVDENKAKKYFSKSDIVKIKKIIEENNKVVSEQKNNLVPVKDSLELQSKKHDEISMSKKKKKTYIKISYKWWGMQVYFSHKAVNDLNDYFAIEGFTAGLGAQEGVRKFLLKKGFHVTSKALGPVALFGSGLTWAMGKVDKGKGVYLNCVLYVPATLTAKK